MVDWTWTNLGPDVFQEIRDGKTVVVMPYETLVCENGVLHVVKHTDHPSQSSLRRSQEDN